MRKEAKSLIGSYRLRQNVEQFLQTINFVSNIIIEDERRNTQKKVQERG